MLGLSALQTGLAYLPFSATMGIASGLIGRLPDGAEPRVSIVAGIAGSAAGLWLLSGLEPQSAYASGVLPALVLVAAGLGVAFVPLMGLATGDAEERDGGLASGLMTSAQQIGGAIGIAIMIAIATGRTTDEVAAGAQPAVALTDGFAAAFQVEAIILLVAALLAAVALGRRRETAEQGYAATAPPAIER